MHQDSSRPPPWLPATARDFAWVAVICALPLALLYEPRQQFGSDWIAILWLTAYFGEFFKHHLAFPEVIHTIQLAGIPYPVFYGFLLYPLLGLISSVTEPHATIRLAVGGVFLLQTWQVLRLMYQAGANRLFGLVTAALACWSTYALTNLYNRGAVNELIATAFLTAAICAVYRACLLPPGPTRWPPLATGLLCLVLAAGSHPITGLFGGMFFALVITVAWAYSDGRGQLAAGLGAGAIVAALVLSPWIYAVLKFGPSLYITQLFITKLSYYPGIDSLATRLMPFPYDRRVIEDPNLSIHQTPYLDAQVTAGLVILAVFLAGCRLIAGSRGLTLNRAGLAIARTGWISFFVVLVTSVSPALGAKLPALFHNMQFAYRLVTYLNLSLLLVVVGSLMALSSDEARKLVTRRGPLVLGATLTLAVCGLALKLQHGWVNKSAAPKVSGSSALILPDGFYGYYAYAVTQNLDAPKPVAPVSLLSLTVGRGPEFGQLAPERFSTPAPEVRLLKVQAFPWNEVLLNGHPAVTADTVNAAEGATISLPAGENEITYAWRPDRLWVGLTILSRSTFLASFILVVILHCRMIRTSPP